MTNVYTKFKGLIANDELDVVEITVDNGDGTKQAITLSGHTITLKGTDLIVGKKAFIRNGEFIREAPNHTIVQVNI